MHFSVFLGISLLLLSPLQVWSFESPWQDKALSEKYFAARSLELETTEQLSAYRALYLDELALRQQLEQAALQATAILQAKSQQISVVPLQAVQLPLPNGDFTSVSIIPRQTLAPQLAARYPTIATWTIHALDNKLLGGVIDFTTAGFHAMLELPNGDTVFIDPQTVMGERIYASFSQRSNARFFRDDYRCDTHQADTSIRTALKNLARRSTAAGEYLYTYRIAIAATAEYTAKHGGTAMDGFSGIVTSLNRINYLYERDLAIRLQLVSDESLVYTDTATDPYTNNNIGMMILENQTHLKASLDDQAYDIGHVFGTSGGGRSYVGVVCMNNYKARGATGLSSPLGDTFDISYVAHEIAHQFGANHTFNGLKNSCRGNNRDAASAYEPGSGSTVMSYAGICGQDNLQTSADSMFHAASIAEIHHYIENGIGARCAQISALNNQKPSIEAGRNYTIPANTPFLLQGSASDADDDSLTYAWEQMDAGTASYVDQDSGDNAIIRSYLPSKNPIRTIPRMADLLSNSQTKGEILPSRTRTLNFRLTVRDGKSVAFDDMLLRVIKTGSRFAVIAPNGKTLRAGSTETIQWNVAGTDQDPIACQYVDIDLSQDQGEHFSLLAARQANTGEAVVQLPLQLGKQNYFRVKCSDNVFFAMSAANDNDGFVASTSDPSLEVTEPEAAAPNNANLLDSELSFSVAKSSGGGSLACWFCLSLVGLFYLRCRLPCNNSGITPTASIHPKH